MRKTERRSFLLPFAPPDALREEIFDLSVERTKIILRPFHKFGVQRRRYAKRDLFFCYISFFQLPFFHNILHFQRAMIRHLPAPLRSTASPAAPPPYDRPIDRIQNKPDHERDSERNGAQSLKADQPPHAAFIQIQQNIFSHSPQIYRALPE